MGYFRPFLSDDLFFTSWFPFLLQVVITQAKVTADQEVMYKYISKNLLFLATVAPKAVGPIGSVTPDESSLVVYVIDTVTGRILHRVTHHGSQGPVHAVSLPFQIFFLAKTECFTITYCSL